MQFLYEYWRLQLSFRIKSRNTIGLEGKITNHEASLYRNMLVWREKPILKRVWSRGYCCCYFSQRTKRLQGLARIHADDRMREPTCFSSDATRIAQDGNVVRCRHRETECKTRTESKCASTWKRVQKSTTRNGWHVPDWQVQVTWTHCDAWRARFVVEDNRSVGTRRLVYGGAVASLCFRHSVGHEFATATC